MTTAAVSERCNHHGPSPEHFTCGLAKGHTGPHSALLEPLGGEMSAVPLTREQVLQAEVQRLTEALQTAREKAFDEIAAHFNRYFDGDIRRELAALRTAGEGQ